jgi:hypothetical protein
MMMGCPGMVERAIRANFYRMLPYRMLPYRVPR